MTEEFVRTSAGSACFLSDMEPDWGGCVPAAHRARDAGALGRD